MQQMLSRENSDPQEIDRLGERYQLGTAQGAHYVAYTQEDIHRYRSTMIACAIVVLCLLVFETLAILSIFTHIPYLDFSLPLPFFYMYPWIIISIGFFSLHRRWGNRPFINPSSRRERVYRYQGGLIKLTAKRCDVVLWSQMYDMVYELPQGGEQPVPLNSGQAGIQLSRYGGPVIAFSGALSDLKELAWHIKQACDQNRHIAVHTDKSTQSPL